MLAKYMFAACFFLEKIHEYFPAGSINFSKEASASSSGKSPITIQYNFM